MCFIALFGLIPKAGPAETRVKKECQPLSFEIPGLVIGNS